jgi:hypothetical protein
MGHGEVAQLGAVPGRELLRPVSIVAGLLGSGNRRGMVGVRPQKRSGRL